MTIKFRNSQTQYGLIGRLLHWTSVILLVTLVVTANKFEGLQISPDKTSLIMQHSSWGLLFLLVMLIRFYWRNTNLNPVRSYRIANWQKFAAIFLHRLIYLIVITQSISGLCYLLFSGSGISLFNFFTFPSFMNSSELFSQVSKRMHYVLSIVIYPLLAIHISAAIYHQLFGVRDHETE